MKRRASDQKLRGSYYTPEPIARFLSDWAIRTAHDEILEPSCGDGAFLGPLVRGLLSCGSSPAAIARQIHAVEFDGAEADKARERLRAMGVLGAKNVVHAGDFFAHCTSHLVDRRFDAAVGNPPFIRYQNFPEEHREVAFRLMRAAGLKPNGLTNAWVPFVCIASTLLKENGRLAMVIPAELLQVSYSAELRRFLSDSFEKVTLFTFKELLFEEAEQEVVLVCAERTSSEAKGIDIVELTSAEELGSYTPRSIPRGDYKPMDHSTEKWTQYFLSRREAFLLRALRKREELPLLGDIASVDVGVVTGLNEFFVLSEEARATRKLLGLTEPVVTKSVHLQGLVYGREQLRAQVDQGARSHLLVLPAAPLGELPAAVRPYIREGEDNGYHLGFKCRIRKHWWAVPSIWVPDGFLLRQVHRYPKLVVNASKATCTDTIHRVRLRNGDDIRHVASAFLNSLTFAFSEVLGRSYGGGVLELEPTEAEHLPLPMSGASGLDLDALDRLVLEGRIDDALAETDRVLLLDGLGLSLADVRCLRGIWKKLMGRRLGRKAKTSTQKTSTRRRATGA